MKTYLYIIKTTNNKYYVGISSNLEHRISQHFKGNGAMFLKRNMPEDVVYTEEIQDPTQAKIIEHDFVKSMGELFGLNNVCGAGRTKIP